MAATARTELTIGAVSWILGALTFLVFEALTAAAVVPTYSYIDAYISGLGVPAWSPNAVLMNSAFLVQGLLFLAGAVLITRALPGGWALVLLAGAVAAGNLLVAIVHGGSTLFAEGYNWLHALGAVLVIVGGNAAILVGSSVVANAVAMPGYRAVSVALAIVGFIGLAMVTIATSTGATDLAVGAWERASVYSILAWQVFTAVVLVARRR